MDNKNVYTHLQYTCYPNERAKEEKERKMTSACRVGAWEVEVPGSGRRKLKWGVAKWSSAPSVWGLWALPCLWQVWQLGSEDVGLDFSREVGPGHQANPGF